MATGTDHYREAERLLGEAECYDRDERMHEGLMREAQVHATLAATAATALNVRGLRADADYAAWREAAGAASPAPAKP